jgi:hypothetical protein
VIRISQTPPGLITFPDFDDARGLAELIRQIALALGTTAHAPVGSPLEQLVGFAGLPESFQLWWDGFTCELGCSAPCDVDMGDILQRLLSSGSFTVAD